MRKVLSLLIVVSLTICIPYLVISTVGMSVYGPEVYNPFSWGKTAKELFIAWLLFAVLWWTYIAFCVEAIDKESKSDPTE